VDVSLRLQDTRLQLYWLADSHPVAILPSPPDDDTLKGLRNKLRMATEISDPSLLKLRNEEIAAELERLTERAAEQMQAMEVVLEDKRLELEATMRQAETDSLTGLLNRGAYDNRLQRTVASAQDKQRPLCLILLDLDFFKQVNDSKGHQYGDRYLQKMADGMHAAIRQDLDIPCRIGGDEFAIICFCELPEAERIARQILEHMNRQVSIGIGRCRAADTPESLAERTDSCLYSAKRMGRNRYITDRHPDHQAANG
jgi:diguanylate cyclase (GGDEF)-like protein